MSEWVWALFRAAFAAVNSAAWLGRWAPPRQRLFWGVQSGGGYGLATVSARRLAATDSLAREREVAIIPHHETFSTTIQPAYSSTKG